MKYDAFISYRHLDKDMYVAKKVHKALETTKIPRKIQKEIGRKKIDRVFRDQEELPIGSDLGSNIEAALQEAAFLVVICSPQTKESYWVMKEIDTFISMHGRENILAVLVDGEPADAFPPQLLNDEHGNPVEPLAADVRGITYKETRKKLKTESMRLAAAILQVDYDDLKQRHKERKMHRNIGIAAVVAALAVAFAGYNAYNLAKINEEYQQKLINESKVLAAKSLEVLEDGDKEAAVLIAMEGLQSEDNERPYVAESVYALSQALGSYDIGATMKADKLLNHVVQVDDFEENVNGKRVISYDTAGFIYLWDLDTGEELFRLPPEYSEYGFDISIYEVGFSTKNALVVNGNGLYAYNDKGEEVYSFIPDGTMRGGKIYEPKNRALITTTDALYLIDTSTGEILKEYDNHMDLEFSGKMIYDSEGLYAAVVHEEYGTEQNYCTLYNLETDESYDYEMKANTLLDGKIGADGSLAFATIDYDDLMSLSTCSMFVQNFDTTSHEERWCNEYEYQGSLLNTSYTYMSTNKVSVNKDIEYGLVVNTPKTVYYVNLENGEAISSYSTDGSIQRVAFNQGGEYIFVGTSDGKVTLYSSNPEITLTENVMEVCDDSMIDFKIQGGCLVARQYRSSNLDVLKYNEDESVLYKSSLDSKISKTIEASPDGTTYLVKMSSTNTLTNSYSYIYNIVDTETGEVKGSFEINTYVEEEPLYLDSDRIFYGDSDGNIHIYNISTNEEDIKKVASSTSINYDVSQNREYILCYSIDNYIVLKSSDITEVCNGAKVEGGYFNDAIIDNKGSIIYSIDRDANSDLAVYDIEKNKYTVFNEDYRVERIQLSNDDSKIAVVCDDVKLRLLDTSSYETLSEVDFYAKSYSGLIEFSEDDSMLFLQGADLYFKIYDLSTKRYVYESSVATNEFDYCGYDAKNNRLIVSNFIGMRIIDLNSMGQLSYIEKGRIYIPQQEMIICANSKNLYAFKFKNVEELLEQANELYGDKKLSQNDRLKYGIY